MKILPGLNFNNYTKPLFDNNIAYYGTRYPNSY
jgi:hypothetical protein